MSTCRGLDVTRWREDADPRLLGPVLSTSATSASDLVWSAGHQPVCRPADDYEVIFAADKATFRRRDAGIETLLEVTVSPEQFAEVRRVTLTNHDDRPRELELTSYAEVVLGPRRPTWRTRPSASCSWRPSGSPAPAPCSAAAGPGRPTRRRSGPSTSPPPTPTRRRPRRRSSTRPTALRFLGRGRTPADPAALDRGAALSGTTGPVLDPVFSLRVRVRLEPGGSAVVAFTTAVAESREEALALADQYHEASAAARAFELAWAHSQIEHRHRGWSPEEAHLFQRLGVARRLRRLRAAAGTGRRRRRTGSGQADLWRYGISGDRPIVLVRVAGDGAGPAGPAAPRWRTPSSGSRGWSSTSSCSTRRRRATSRS